MIASVEEWIEALRSGDFVQTQGALQDKKKCNCCLGVYCIISGEDFHEEITAGDWEALEVNDMTLWLPDYELREKFGNNFLDKFVFLALLNDSGFTFEHIANFLEAGEWPENLEEAANNLTYEKPWN